MLRTIQIDWPEQAECPTLETPFPAPEPTLPYPGSVDPETFADFLDAIGLVGMGGSGFRTSEKIRRSSNVHTLVINGVECEPGVSIDTAVLLNDASKVIAGTNAIAGVIGAQRIVLAIKNTPDVVAEIRRCYTEFDIETFSAQYPAGAEKLILNKLTGDMPAPGVRPYQLGYLVHNVVSLRAIGRAILDGIPVVERPLSLVMPSIGFSKNCVVPVGLPIRELLEIYELPIDPDTDLIIDSGLMMGSEVGLDDRVKKTTLSLFVLNRASVRRQEHPCTRCGACNAACPLGLHPFTLTEQIRKEKTAGISFQAQMTECFLCGVCSAVCPSDIPLIQILERGKQCL